MGILIPRQLAKEQYIKLFSNPVSGIACEVSPYIRDHGVKHNIQNIRYSKSMLLGALYFWEKQYDEYNRRLKWAQFNPIFSNDSQPPKENLLLKSIMLVHNLPNSFLFSHRYISSQWGTRDSKAMCIQHDLLAKKYPELFKMSRFTGYTQDNKKELCCYIELGFLEFTVFPNEHPYITKQKISKVGMTDRGNVFILHKKDSNGAQTKK
jgi:hypothetical protein